MNTTSSKMITRVYKYCVKHKWELGFVTNPIEEILAGKKMRVWWVRHDYKDRWFADPFILKETSDSITLLVEEYYDPIERGRIARLVIDKKTHRVVSNDLVLQLDTHLSFPAIVRQEGRIFIYPENFQSGRLKIYEYSSECNKCREVGILCDEPLTDAVSYRIDGRDYLFSTTGNDPNGRHLGIYGKEKDGKYIRKQTVSFAENIARMAGDFFYVGNDLYRPAQESNTTYGHAVSIQRVISKKDGWDMQEVVRIPSPHKIHKLTRWRN